MVRYCTEKPAGPVLQDNTQIPQGLACFKFAHVALAGNKDPLSIYTKIYIHTRNPIPQKYKTNPSIDPVMSCRILSMKYDRGDVSHWGVWYRLLEIKPAPEERTLPT